MSRLSEAAGLSRITVGELLLDLLLGLDFFRAIAAQVIVAADGSLAARALVAEAGLTVVRGVAHAPMIPHTARHVNPK